MESVDKMNQYNWAERRAGIDMHFLSVRKLHGSCNKLNYRLQSSNLVVI